LRSAEGHLLNVPDANRVIVELCKRSGGGNNAMGRGLVERVRPGVYRLTDLGRQEAVDLAKRNGK
jgi:hypothetical protein